MNPGFEEIMSIRGRGTPESGEVTITGRDPVFSTCFKVGETTANILAGTRSQPPPAAGWLRYFELLQVAAA